MAVSQDSLWLRLWTQKLKISNQFDWSRIPLETNLSTEKPQRPNATATHITVPYGIQLNSHKNTPPFQSVVHQLSLQNNIYVLYVCLDFFFGFCRLQLAIRTTEQKFFDLIESNYAFARYNNVSPMIERLSVSLCHADSATYQFYLF